MKGKLIDARVVGLSIKALRLANHLTQEELANRVGYSVRNLRRIENDGTVNIDTVNYFAEIFDVSALDILNGCFFITFDFYLWPKCNEFYLLMFYFVVLKR